MTMLKKLISLILVLIPVAMSAQLAVGGWTLHTPYRNVDRMAETTVYVYYMSQGALSALTRLQPKCSHSIYPHFLMTVM